MTASTSSGKPWVPMRSAATSSKAAPSKALGQPFRLLALRRSESVSSDTGAGFVGAVIFDALDSDLESSSTLVGPIRRAEEEPRRFFEAMAGSIVLEPASRLYRRWLDPAVGHPIHYVTLPWPPSAAVEVSSADVDVEHAWDELLRALDECPVESGVPHRAEATLREVLLRGGGPRLLAAPVEYRYGLYRLLGRVAAADVPPNVEQFVLQGLEDPKITLRDAAVRALESWGTRRALDAIDNHSSIEQVKWLADYCRAVVRHHQK